MITAGQHELVMHFNQDDWVYGLKAPRDAIHQSLIDKINPDDALDIVWRVDDINEKIIYLTSASKKITLDSATPKYLTTSANKFCDYLKQLEQSEEFIKVVSDDHYLTRYLCKEGIKFILSDGTPSRIHFLLDGIDLAKALIETDNECFTASEIREIVRNIENPNMASKIFFYRDGVRLDFNNFKNEILQILHNDSHSIDLHNSPIRKTKYKYDDVKANRQSKSAANRIVRSKRLFLGLPETSTDTMLDPALQSAAIFFNHIADITDPVFDKLNKFVFNKDLIRTSINKLHLILKDIDLDEISKNINNGLLKKDEIKKSMLLLVKQFPQQADLDENFMMQQVTEDKQNYLLPIRQLLDNEFNIGSISAEILEQLKTSIDKIKAICTFVFVANLPAANLSSSSANMSIGSILFSSLSSGSSSREASLTKPAMRCKKAIFN